MYLKNLRLFNFRNISNSTLSFHKQINLISGENAQGKSNLLEAIHYLSATRSFRSTKIAEMVHWERSEFSIFGDLVGSYGTKELGIIFSENKRQIQVNGDRVKKAQDYIGSFPVVTFAPHDIDLVFGSPSGRRRVLDQYTSLIFPKIFTSLKNYQKAVRSKSVLLKGYRVEQQQVEALNKIIAKEAVQIVRARRDLLSRITPFFSSTYQKFSGEEKELKLFLKESFLEEILPEKDREEISLIVDEPDEERYFQVLSDLMNKEIQRRRILVGVHLDDFYTMLGGRDARSFASQGQARSIVLTLLISLVSVIQKSLNTSPVLLLDDFSSELDRGRMERFFELLSRASHQVFITGTELSGEMFKESGYSHFSVSNGLIEQL